MTDRIYGPLHEARIVTYRLDRRHVLAPRARHRTRLDGRPTNRQVDDLSEHQRCIQASARWR